MRSKTRLSPTAGFSLLEIMVAIGISMGLGLILATMTYNQYKTSRGLRQKLDAIELERDLRHQLVQGNSCNCMFRGIEWTTVNPGTELASLQLLKDGCNPVSTSVFAYSGQAIPRSTNRLTVESIKLKNVKDTSEPDLKKGMADLEIQFSQISKAAPVRPILIQGMEFIIDKNKLISSCVGFGDETSTVCAQLGGSWNMNTNGSGHCNLSGSNGSGACLSGFAPPPTKCNDPEIKNWSPSFLPFPIMNGSSVPSVFYGKKAGGIEVIECIAKARTRCENGTLHTDNDCVIDHCITYGSN